MSLFAFCIAGTALSYLMGLRTPGRGYGTVAGWATSLGIGVILGLLYYVFSSLRAPVLARLPVLGGAVATEQGVAWPAGGPPPQIGRVRTWAPLTFDPFERAIGDASSALLGRPADLLPPFDPLAARDTPLAYGI